MLSNGAAALTDFEVCQEAPHHIPLVRCINMDYSVFSSLEGSEIIEIIVSYNIAY